MIGYETAQLYNYIGICEGQLGHAVASIEAHTSAVSMDSKVHSRCDDDDDHDAADDGGGDDYDDDYYYGGVVDDDGDDDEYDVDHPSTLSLVIMMSSSPSIVQGGLRQHRYHALRTR